MPPGIRVSHTQRQTWDFNVRSDLNVYLLRTLLCRIVNSQVLFSSVSLPSWCLMLALDSFSVPVVTG